MSVVLLCFDSVSVGRVLFLIATEDLVQLSGKSPALAGRELIKVLSVCCQSVARSIRLSIH